MSRLFTLLCGITLVGVIGVTQTVSYFYYRNLVNSKIDAYDTGHRRDARICRASEASTCPAPGECQRSLCFKFRDITDPNCMLMPDVDLDGTACDDDDPDSSESYCVRGICEGNTTAPTSAPTPPIATSAPTPAVPTPAPTPSISLASIIRSCLSNETALCAVRQCQFFDCYVIEGNSADPLCAYGADVSANGDSCDDGNDATHISSCYEGECQGTVSKAPTASPTVQPTKSPTMAPTKLPSKAPTVAPTPYPTRDGIRPCDEDEYSLCGIAAQCTQFECRVIDEQVSEPFCVPVANVSTNGEACDDGNDATYTSSCFMGECQGTVSASPTRSPTLQPTLNPTASPTLHPTRSPTVSPTPRPTIDNIRPCDSGELALCGPPLKCTLIDCRIVGEQVDEPICTPLADLSLDGTSCDDGDANTADSVCFEGVCRADAARECTSLEIEDNCGSLNASVCSTVGCIVLPSGSVFCADRANHSADGVACDYNEEYLDVSPRAKCVQGHCVPLQTATCNSLSLDSPVYVLAGQGTTFVLYTETGLLSNWGFLTGYGVSGVTSGNQLYDLPYMRGYNQLRNGTLNGPYLFATDLSATSTGCECVILNNSRVMCWGSSTFGENGYGISFSSGDGGSGPYAFLHLLPGFVRIHEEGGVEVLVKKIFSGSSASRTCVIFVNDRYKCWGSGTSGALGTNDTLNIGDNELPVSVPNYGYLPTVNQTVLSIALASTFTCVITLDRIVYCWGSNTIGQLGLGHFSSRTIAIEATNVSSSGDPPRQLAAGNLHMCVLLENSRDVKCWGQGLDGKLGQNATTNLGDTPSTIPALIPPIVGIVSNADYAAGVRVEYICAGTSHTCALLNNSQVKCWGLNNVGQLGYGTNTAVGSSPANALTTVGYGRMLSADDLARGLRIIQLTCGATHNCILLSDQQLRCWGQASGYGSSAARCVANGTCPSNGQNIQFRPIENTPTDYDCSCVCAPVNTSANSFADDFLIGSSGVECPQNPTPVGAQYCPSSTYPEPHCVCNRVIRSAIPTRSPTASPTRSPTMSPTPSPTAPTASPTLSPTLSPTPSPTLSPVPAPP